VTTSVAQEIATRAAPRGKVKRSLAGDLADYMEYKLDAATRIRFPSEKYRKDPVAFCREILGVEPWAKQIEIIEAVRDHQRVAVRSGHKVGKSRSCAMLALWYFCSYPDARVVMTSTTARQVDQILWREVKMVRARGGRCVDCKAAVAALMRDGKSQIEAEHRHPKPCPHSTLIEDEPGELARTGLKSADFREIVGFTAKEGEAVAGISGENLLYLIDEASGIGDDIFNAIEGNRAGGARAALFGNPTQNEGEFFEAFHAKEHLYRGITVSSEETPNVVAGEKLIPGLAERGWIEEKKLEWGVESALYKIRVQGVHATREDGKIFSVHAIKQAEEAWHEVVPEGRLYIGLDPAGATGLGDETAMAPRRGPKSLEILLFTGLNSDGIIVNLIGLIRKHKIPRETPVVVVDRDGSIGAEVFGSLRAYVEKNPAAFELVGVRGSDRSQRQPEVFHLMRDALTANLEAWVRDGGGIPTDAKLAKELHAMEWRQKANGLTSVTPKEQLRKILGRSPDRYDALALSCWEPLSLRADADTNRKVEATAAIDARVPTMDPYAGLSPFGGRGRRR
jgi:phage terminase large subunit